MEVSQKIQIGILAVVVWALAIIAKHNYPDVASDLNVMVTLCQGTLLGLGITHLASNPDTPQVLPPPDSTGK